jgi:hypothetical protein
VDRRVRRALRAAVEPIALESLEGRRMFDATPLTLQRTLTNTPPGTAELFGDKMATLGDLILVGQPANAGGAGEAKLLDSDGNLITTITNPDAQSDDGFGDAVGIIDSTHIAIRSVEGFTGDSRNPIVYIYTISGNSANLSATITAPEDNDFGNSLASVGGDLLVSTPGANLGEGAVYRYNVDGTPDANAQYTLPGSFDFSRAMVADPNGSTMLFSNGNGAGRTVVEMNASGTVVQTYTEDGDPFQSGSFAIAFNDDSVFIGDASAGRVTQFNRTTGSIVDTITDGGAGSGFGASVIINGDNVVIGSFVDVNVYDDDFTSANDPIGTATLPAGTFVDGVYNLSGTEILVADPFAATDESTFAAGQMYVYDLAELGGPPANTNPTADAGADQSAVRQQTVSFTGAGSDAEDGSNVAYAWDFNYDGVTFDVNASTQNASSSYATAGTYTLALRVTDTDGASTIDTLQVTVSASQVVGGTMFVGGTNGTDTVIINGNTVTINGANQTFTGGKVVVYGGPGTDVIGVIGSTTKALEAHGGDGNDVLSGGNGADVLIGDAGNDIIAGGGGRDLLIGGSGSDLVAGLAADDILIAGSTVHDNNTANLANILSIWNGAGTYTTRVNALLAGPLTPDTDVFDDNAVDILTGNAGTDWFLFNNDGSNAHDLVLDRNSAEVASDLDVLPA